MKSRKDFPLFLFSLFLFLARGTSGASEGLWLDVPYVHQEKDGCGSASIAMLMQYWLGKPTGATILPDRADPSKIQQQLYSRDAHGIYASAMQEYLRSSGFEVFAFRGEWKDFREHLSKGRPLIVSLKPHRLALHYVVVVGVEAGDNAVLLNDSARSKLLRVNRIEFDKEWREAGSWTLLAVPKPSPQSSH